MSPAFAALVAATYVILGRALRGLAIQLRDPLFTLLNLVAVYLLFFWHADAQHPLLYSLPLILYLAVVSLQYLAMRIWSRSAGILPWLAFFAPLSVLIAVRYVPFVAIASAISKSGAALWQANPQLIPSRIFVGISYLAFRSSYLVLEVRNGVVPRPTLSQYLGFAFFAPTLSVGPINRYSDHRRAFRDAAPLPIPAGTAALRVVVGAVKYKFLGPLLNQFTYSGLMLDGHPHRWVDLAIAAVAYYGYIYCNFSGFCDMAIGAAGLMGIPVAENFANPFGARNMKEFWNRWHITLSQYMRDVVFAPLSRALVRLLGPSQANHAIAVTILFVFVLVGVWHGVGWHYAAFGLSQGLAVAGNHYYTLALKKRLGKERFAAYNRSRTIHAAAVALTFLYTSASIFLFANDWSAMKAILSSLRTS
jgi:D-alanyl-lipoteichoic acid acyltransferase DltB (MBOAT superfamily)